MHEKDMTWRESERKNKREEKKSKTGGVKYVEEL